MPLIPLYLPNVPLLFLHSWTWLHHGTSRLVTAWLTFHHVKLLLILCSSSFHILLPVLHLHIASPSLSGLLAQFQFLQITTLSRGLGARALRQKLATQENQSKKELYCTSPSPLTIGIQNPFLQCESGVFFGASLALTLIQVCGSGNSFDVACLNVIEQTRQIDYRAVLQIPNDGQSQGPSSTGHVTNRLSQFEPSCRLFTSQGFRSNASVSNVRVLSHV